MNINRRQFLKLTGLTATTLAASAFMQCGPNKRRPNVLFIAVDDLRPELGCYGQSHILSPNIDKLASEGILFTNTYCQVPVCGASRASLLTGMRPKRDRFINFMTWADRDAPGNIGLPRHFRENGYHTVSNSKVYHHQTDGEGCWDEPAWWPEGDGKNYLLPENHVLQETNKFRHANSTEAADVADNAYFDGQTADRSIADLKRLKNLDQPFFLAVGFVKPHLPFNAPKTYWDLYDPEKIEPADNPWQPLDAPDASMTHWRELRLYTDIPDKGPVSDEKARTLLHGYYACVSYIDAQIGRVLSTLDELGLRDNTIVILWGDHGYNLGEHGLWAKHCNYRTSLQAPMIVRAPGYRNGATCDALTEFVDIYPTLSELCGLPIPEQCQGDSFIPLLNNPEKPWKQAVFSRFRKGDSIKTEQYSYTEYTEDDGTFIARMLYDHKNDPNENVNISELPEHAELVRALSKRLKAGWQGEKIIRY